MVGAYTVVAKRSAARPGGLTIGYPSKKLALKAAKIVFGQWPIVSVMGPDGSVVAELGSDGA